MADTTALKNRICAAIKANDNQEITGLVLQQTLLDVVDELSDRFINEYGFIGVAIPSTIPPSDLTEYSRVFYLTAQNGVYTNLGGVEVSNEIAVIKYNGSNWSKELCTGIDDTPTSASSHLVKSGGVFEKMKLDGGAYDVSAHNEGAKFASLSALLNSDNLNTLIPVNARHGGMSIKFVQSSDNKYGQFRYMPDDATTVETFTNTDNWQNQGAEVSVSQNTSTGNDILKAGDTELASFADAGKLIKLIAISSSRPSGMQEGECYYNFNTKKIIKKISDGGGDDSIIIPFYEGSIYQNGDLLLAWNGTDLVPYSSGKILGEYIAGRRLNYSGTFTENSAYSCTDYIPVNEGDKIICSGSVYQGTGLVMGGYDAHKLFVQQLIIEGHVHYKQVTIPAGISYIVCCGYNETATPSPIVLPQVFADNYVRDNELSIPYSIYGYIDSSGNFQAQNNRYSRTLFIPVKEGMKIKYTGSTGSAGMSIAGYDENKLFVSEILSYGDYENEVVTIPSGIFYIVCCGRNENFEPAINTKYLPLLFAQYDDSLNAIILSLNYISEQTFNNKKLVVLGDSIPQGQSFSVPSGATQCYQPFPALIAKGLNMRLKNYAIGGSTFAVSPLILGDNEKQYGGTLTAWDATNKDTSKYYIVLMGSPSTTGVGDYGGTTYYHNGTSWTTSSINSRTPISERFSIMDNDADIVLVSCGSNDFQYNWTEIGSINDTTDATFYGAVKKVCEGLLQKYFGKTIVFCTPIKRCQTQSTTSDTPAHNGGNYGTIDSQNTFNKTLKEYGDIIKEVCARYSIPVFDMYAESGLNPQLSSQSLLFDTYKTHPTQAGHEKLAKVLCGKLKTVLGEIEY